MKFSSQVFRNRIGAALPLNSKIPDSAVGRTQLGSAGRSGGETVDLGQLWDIDDDKAFLERAYLLIFRRPCDLSGFVNCIEMLRNHVSRRVVVLQLVNSAEASAMGVKFTGIPDQRTSAARKQGLPFFQRLSGRPIAMAQALIRQLLHAPMDSLSNRLSQFIDAVSVRLDQSSEKADQNLWTLGSKIDQTAVILGASQREHAAGLRADSAAEFATIRKAVADLQAGQQELREAIRKSAATISGGNNVIATEVDGFIVGIPGEEWRLAAYHAFRGFPEPGTMKLFASLIKPGMTVVDIGANIGAYSLLACRQLNGAGHVCAFEPTPRTYEILRDNVQVNGYLEIGLIDLRRLAVADRTGLKQLSVFVDNCGHNTLFGTSDGAEKIEVNSTSLDEFFSAGTRVDVVKIDVEGAEPLVLRGMRRLIRDNPDIRIILEFAPEHLCRAGVDPGAFLGELERDGFLVSRINEETGEHGVVSPDRLIESYSSNLYLTRKPLSLEPPCASAS